MATQVQMRVIAALLVVVLVGVCLAAKEEDEVDHLPHLIGDQPSFRHYAGHLDAGDGKKFFYWFVESESDPDNDPVVLWLNGGPGCSSLTGFLVELGPWRVTPDGENLVWFEERWNKRANMIFMESPQCVGYSYSESGHCESSDDQARIYLTESDLPTAEDNHAALRDFFSYWPELRDNEFYITGESYAGIYVPTLSVRIMNDPDFNFIGMAIGNGVTDRRIMTNGFTYFAWARGLFSSQLWSDLLDHCCVERNSSDCEFYQSEDDICRGLVRQVNDVQWRIGLNPYHVYDECYGGIPSAQGVIRQEPGHVTMMHPDAVIMPPWRYNEYMTHYLELSSQMNVTVTIPCTDTSDRDNYLNKAEVREALHVPEFVRTWEACSNNASRWYDRQYTDMAPQYLSVLDQGYRVLVFNGDLDMACDHLSDMWFVENLQQEETAPFKEWTYPDSLGYDQIAGFVLQYENLKYLSVKGAGHFVPTDKPLPALIMWEKFLDNEDY